MAVKQFYGRRRRDLELWLYRWKTPGLLGIRRMDGVLNAWITELCRVKKWMDEWIDEGMLLWFSHVERMEK